MFEENAYVESFDSFRLLWLSKEESLVSKSPHSCIHNNTCGWLININLLRLTSSTSSTSKEQQLACEIIVVSWKRRDVVEFPFLICNYKPLWLSVVMGFVIRTVWLENLFDLRFCHVRTVYTYMNLNVMYAYEPKAL